MERTTEELPSEGSSGREPTLPLPAPDEPPRRGPRDPRVVWFLVVLLAVVGAFLAGWTLRGPGDGRAARPTRADAAPLPTRDARYCGGALDVAARILQIYRSALENRALATEAAVDGNLAVMRRLDGQLAGMQDAADRLQRRVTRALAVCPS